ncbi:MAG: RNA-binding domain-containing protein [Candidatus Bathyarchaeia archaeon]
MGEIGEVKLNIEVEVNTTEDSNKVRVAVQKIFGNLDLVEVKNGDQSRLVSNAEGLEALEAFHELLRKERILDAARKMLFNGLKGKTITFFLNKQAAYVGHISFSQPVGESPLGPIRVEVQCDNPKGLIDWLTPKTRQ